MAAWESVYENQMTLWKFYSGAFGRDTLNNFVVSMLENGREGERSIAEAFHHGILADGMVRGLYKADPVYISPEMAELHRAAFPGFQVEPLLPQDLITNFGFVMFPEPLYLTDINWKKLSWRGLAWWPVMTTPEVGSGIQRPGIFFALFSDVDDDDDFHETIRPMFEDLQRRFGPMPKLGMSFFTVWRFGEGGPENSRGNELFQQVQTFFRLTQQTITTQQQIPLGRATRRRAQRAKQPEKKVTVIRLRRPKHATEHEGEPVAWTHRWVVRGHWRNQWFPSTKTHRQIWIHDFIKGPDDKPLRITERRAFELVQ